MKKENLLIDCNIKSVRQRLETTLSNIQFQRGTMLWDDEEKIEHCIEVLKILEKENKVLNNTKLERTSQYINERYNLDTWVNEQTKTIWISVWNKELTDSYDIEMSKEQTEQFYNEIKPF
tara:strand:- start:338 stop:697 length:360 start_codon:yes stop_codon:yes gene_type:complete